MRFKFKGEELEFDETRLAVGEAQLLKKQRKLTPKAFFQGLPELDPDALLALVYLAKQRAGERPRWSELEDFDLFSDFELIADEDDVEDEDVDEDLLDPT